MLCWIVIVCGRWSIKRANISFIKKGGTLADKEAPDLEKAGYKVAEAHAALNKAIWVLGETYPALITLANKLPLVNKEHPYLRIRQAYYLYKWFRCRHIYTTYQPSQFGWGKKNNGNGDFSHNPKSDDWGRTEEWYEIYHLPALW